MNWLIFLSSAIVLIFLTSVDLFAKLLPILIIVLPISIIFAFIDVFSKEPFNSNIDFKKTTEAPVKKIIEKENEIKKNIKHEKNKL